MNGPQKCCRHPQHDATAKCEACNQGLCAACAARFDAFVLRRSLIVVACEGCVLTYERDAAREIRRRLSVALLFFLAAMALVRVVLPGVSEHAKWILTALLASSYWGWRSLKKFLGAVGRKLSSYSADFFVVKLTLALGIGMFVAPFLIFKDVRRLIAACRLLWKIARGRD